MHTIFRDSLHLTSVYVTKQTIADDPEGSVVRAVANSLINMERSMPGSCEVFVSRLLQRLARFKEFFHIYILLIVFLGK